MHCKCFTNSSTCEHSFSAMQSIETWLRTSIAQDRFSYISLLIIERDIWIEIDTKINVNKFATKDRKILLKAYEVDTQTQYYNGYLLYMFAVQLISLKLKCTTRIFYIINYYVSIGNIIGYTYFNIFETV